MARRRTLELTVAQRQKLLHYRDHDPRPYVRERCAALLKIADGQSAHAVARQGRLKPRDPDTVYSWICTSSWPSAGAPLPARWRPPGVALTAATNCWRGCSRHRARKRARPSPHP